MDRRRFSEWKHDEVQVWNSVMEVFEGSGLRADLDYYSLEDHGARIQAYYDRVYPGQYKIFGFTVFLQEIFVLNFYFFRRLVTIAPTIRVLLRIGFMPCKFYIWKMISISMELN